ncbi:hypothetical protein HW555_005436 [Spodoptera exigua]|uniref:Uncharacterized protein n=1 Tax=Spodoptera exigua TaxID=7107 RepID=A0A835GKH5_SPOEX|nr:hypothetical protein HW555_005436 [Spodoptera exigua]
MNLKVGHYHNKDNDLLWCFMTSTRAKACSIMPYCSNKVEPGSIATCHRIGAMSKDHHRPILIKFTTIETKATVWRAKTRLRGTSISAKEFLTRTRQAVFARARQHFGMRICWTQDGVIHVKVPDGTRHKVTTDAELDVLLKKYPKSSGVSSMESDVGAARQLKPAKKHYPTTFYNATKIVSDKITKEASGRLLELRISLSVFNWRHRSREIHTLLFYYGILRSRVQFASTEHAFAIKQR